MGTDYDALYARTPDALGPPTPVITEVFTRLDRPGLRVLDVGCGQGRDALFIARLGHRVTGVDIAPNGIRDMTRAAAREGLSVEGVVADIRSDIPAGVFDVILVDRTLHMLPPGDRGSVLARLLDRVDAGGWLLIADEPSNIPAFEREIARHVRAWTVEDRRRGYLFARRS